ncbi:hypothetical protein HYT00_01510 [Candidatus Giovannonibacteria bacterium]|nr:hypothetical protein [Candidatus Giovannonibacteria bacterium]
MIPIELSLNASEYDIAKARQLLKQAGEDAHEFFMEVFQLGLGPNFRLGAAHFTLSRSPKIDWQFIEQLVFGKIKSIYGFSQILRIQ